MRKKQKHLSLRMLVALLLKFISKAPRNGCNLSESSCRLSCFGVARLLCNRGGIFGGIVVVEEVNYD